MEALNENIEILYKKTVQYSKTSFELLKLHTIEKTAVVISSMTILISIAFIFGMFLIFATIGISLYIGNILENNALGFVLVSGFYFILGIMVYVFRKCLIKIPVENLIISKLLKEDKI
jgi:hypothetical protein